MTTPDKREQEGNQPIPEALGVGNLIWVDSADLMRDNPAALIVNTESYNRISVAFSVEQFDPPQVARVATYSSEGSEVTRLFVIDGHTRTKFASDHPEVMLASFRYRGIPVRDVTASQLRSPIVVLEDERQENQLTLTMVQYLRAVVPPTVEHSQIAPDRIAAHLINGWRNMVGEELAHRFSAIAALSLLENPRLPIATDNLLNQFLRKQDEVLAGETPQEREKIEKALREVASIVRQTKLFRDKIAESAFILVASSSSVIGGEDEALKQIYGLLHTPGVEQKLLTISQAGERERLRSELGQLVGETFRRTADTPNQEQVIGVLTEALRDHNLNLDQIRQVFTSEAPGETYNHIRQDINSNSLKQAYLTAQRKDELTDREILLIGNLGHRTFLSEREVPSLTRTIRETDNTIKVVEDFGRELNDRRDQFLGTGVNAQTLDTIIESLEQRTAAVLTVNSLQILVTKTRELGEGVSEAKRKIGREQGVYRLGKVIDEVYEDELVSGYGPQIRSNLISYILREVDDVSSDSVVRQRINQLKSLDNDLQSRVISGDIRLIAAARIQADRRRSLEEDTTVIIPGIPNSPDASAATTDLPTAGPDQPIAPPPLSGGREIEGNKTDFENRRRTLNNSNLVQATRLMRQALSNLDLEPSEVSSENYQVIDQILNDLGKLRFNHPDVVRVIQDYQRRLAQQIEGQEAKVEQDIEEAQGDTRTKI